MRIEQIRKVISLDQSLTDIGISTWDVGEDTIASSHYKPKEKGVKRLNDIHSYLSNLLEKFDPDVVLMEDYAYGAIGHAFSLGELGGVIKLLLFSKGIRCMSIPIGVWKKHLSGNGAIKKDMVLKETLKQFSVDFDNDNLADSYCMLEAFRTFYYDHMSITHDRKDWQVAAIKSWGKNTSMLDMFNQADQIF